MNMDRTQTSSFTAVSAMFCFTLMHRCTHIMMSWKFFVSSTQTIVHYYFIWKTLNALKYITFPLPVWRNTLTLIHEHRRHLKCRWGLSPWNLFSDFGYSSMGKIDCSQEHILESIKKVILIDSITHLKWLCGTGSWCPF